MFERVETRGDSTEGHTLYALRTLVCWNFDGSHAYVCGANSRGYLLAFHQIFLWIKIFALYKRK